jgi:hypothetical protein
MENLVIIVEGYSDLLFIRDCIIKNFTSYNLVKDCNTKDEKVELKSKTKHLFLRVTETKQKINDTGGWCKLKTTISLLKDEFPNNEFKLLVLFDADSSKIENIAHKEKLISDWCQGLNYETFYLPFNKKDEFDDLEDLIFKCITDKFNFFFECWSGFMGCLEDKFKGEINYPEKKRKLFTFKESFKKDNPTIDENYLDSKFWDINFETNKSLEPLKSFLDKNIV